MKSKKSNIKQQISDVLINIYAILVFYLAIAIVCCCVAPEAFSVFAERSAYTSFIIEALFLLVSVGACFHFLITMYRLCIATPQAIRCVWSMLIGLWGRVVYHQTSELRKSYQLSLDTVGDSFLHAAIAAVILDTTFLNFYVFQPNALFDLSHLRAQSVAIVWASVFALFGMWLTIDLLAKPALTQGISALLQGKEWKVIAKRMGYFSVRWETIPYFERLMDRYDGMIDARVSKPKLGRVLPYAGQIILAITRCRYEAFKLFLRNPFAGRHPNNY